MAIRRLRPSSPPIFMLMYVARLGDVVFIQLRNLKVLAEVEPGASIAATIVPPKAKPPPPVCVADVKPARGMV